MPKGTPIRSTGTRAQASSRLGRSIRSIAAGLCIAVTGLAFAGYTVTRWAEHQVLSTDGWVSYAAQLPENSDVSWAVADKLVQQLFAHVAIEQTIAEALPPRAAFLASPLSDQVRTRSVHVVQRAVQSDRFQGIWVGANRLAMERLLTNARSGKTPQSLQERFNIDLADTRPLLRERLASQAELSPTLQEKSQQLIAISTDLRERRERVWDAVRTADFLYAVLPFVFVASFLSALVLGASRRRTVMFIAGTSAAFLLVKLIGVKHIRGQMLGDVQNPAYEPAVSFIYDSLLAGLRTAGLYGLSFWMIVLALCLAAGPAKWAVALRRFLRLPALAKSRPGVWWQNARGFTARYRSFIWTGVIGLMLVYLAFSAHITTAVVTNSLLAALSGICIIQLLSQRGQGKIS